MTTSIPSTLNLVSAPNFVSALEALAPEYSLIAEEDFVPANTDVGEAAATALWAATRMETEREALASTFPSFVAYLNKLVPVAQAAMQAQFDFDAASTPPESLPELEAKLSTARGLLLADIEGLIRRGLLDRKDLPDTGTPNNHRNLAYGVGALVSLLRENWTKISARTALTPEELDEAQQLSQRMAVSVVGRERGPSALGKSTLVRRQTFTLLFRTYDELRRAYSFLRWKDKDADDFCPSLYVNQRSRPYQRKKEVSAASTPSSTGAGVVMQPAPGDFSAGSGMPGESPTG